MNYIILDLEWNASYSKKLKRYVNEIIEFGAVKCDEHLNIISTFSSFVKYQIGKKLSTVVSELTHISDEHLNHEKPFMNVASKFKKWTGDDCLILTWGNSDILALIDNYKYFSGNGNISFLKKYADLQKYCEALLKTENNTQLGLNTAAEILSIDLSKIKQHRALDDSLLSLAIMKRLWTQQSIDKYVEDATNPEFYKKITFKTSIISDMSHPLVNQKKLFFTCEKCSGNTKRRSKWQFRNKRFVADFHCTDCGYEFSGRIQLKEKYDGLVVSKKVVALSKIQEPRKAKNAELGNMQLCIESNSVGLLRFNKWNDFKRIRHAFSTRIGGVSSGIYSSMNLGFSCGDEISKVTENYSLFCKAFGCSTESLVAGNQDHHCNIKRVSSSDFGTGISKPKFTESFDGLCTNEKGVTLVIYCSDCVPIYFYDPVKECIALCHAGWRGTVNGMAQNAIETMQKEFSSSAENILVAIGPSISKKAFEVDEPCADEFMKLDNFEKFVEHKHKKKYLVDLWECNRQFLLKSGVKPENITVGNVCTVQNSDLVFSHRVTKGRRGSNAAFMQII